MPSSAVASPLGIVSFDKVYEGEEGGLERAAADCRPDRRPDEREVETASASGASEQPLPVQTVAVAVPFSSVNQWNGIRTQLAVRSGHRRIDVTTMGSAAPRSGCRSTTGSTSFSNLWQSSA